MNDMISLKNAQYKFNVEATVDGHVVMLNNRTKM